MQAAGYTGNSPTERESVLDCGAAAPLSECLRIVRQRRVNCSRKRQNTTPVRPVTGILHLVTFGRAPFGFH